MDKNNNKEDLNMDNTNDLLIFLKKYGVRYVIRNFKLTPEIIERITYGEFSTINDEDDITQEEINIYQQKFYMSGKK